MSPIDVMVEPRPMEKAWTTDSFGSVAKATGSETLSGPVSLGSLWASLPGLAELTDVPEHAQPLPVVPVEQRVDLPINLDKVPAVIVGIDSGEGEEVDKQEAEELLSYYPAGRMTTIFHPPGLPSPQRQLTGRGSGLSVWWPADSPDYLGHQRTLDRYAPYDQYTGERWLRPALEDGQLPAPLIVWWALLFALSMLARYEPAAWAAALDYDESGLAAPLAQLLEAGVDLVPQLVLSALFRQA